MKGARIQAVTRAATLMVIYSMALFRGESFSFTHLSAHVSATYVHRNCEIVARFMTSQLRLAFTALYFCLFFAWICHL